jgi:hypothetical protein
VNYQIHLDADEVAPWVERQVGVDGLAGQCTAIGLSRGDGEFCGAACFTQFNGVNVQVHLAIEDTWCTSLLLTLIGRYVFEQLALRRLTILVERSNLRAVRLYQRLGAIPEGCMVGAARGGDDILIFRVMHDCIYWRRSNEQRRKRSIHAGLPGTHPPTKSGQPPAGGGWGQPGSDQCDYSVGI